MGWNDLQNGQFNGNRPDPNNVQATQDYNRGYSERIAADNAARAAQQAASIPAYTPPPAPTYNPPSAYSSPASSYTPFTPSFTPSSSSSSGGGYSGYSNGGSVGSRASRSDYANFSTASAQQLTGKTTGSFGRFLGNTLGLLLLAGLLVGGAAYARGYLAYSGSEFVLNATPAIQTPNGPSYRKFDMNMEFHDRNIWTKPEQVVPNSFIDGGPIWNANLICPSGSFTIKGELRGSKIVVPHGTLTITGDVIDSYIAADRIVVLGMAARTREVAGQINNQGSLGPGNRIVQKPDGTLTIDSANKTLTSR